MQREDRFLLGAAVLVTACTQLCCILISLALDVYRPLIKWFRVSVSRYVRKVPVTSKRDEDSVGGLVFRLKPRPQKAQEGSMPCS